MQYMKQKNTMHKIWKLQNQNIIFNSDRKKTRVGLLNRNIQNLIIALGFYFVKVDREDAK